MKKLHILLFATAMVALTSCLKDGNVNLGPGAPTSPPVIEWATAQIDDGPKNGNTSSFRLYSRALPIGNAITMTLAIDLTGSDTAPSDITVGLGTNNAAYTTFVGTVTATTPPQLPTAAYTMPSSVVIAKGTRGTTLNVIVNSTLLDPTKNYYLPVAITSTTYGQVSGNYGTIIYAVVPANRFDGLYTYTMASSATIKPGVTVQNASLMTTVPTSGTALSTANSVTTTLFQDPSYASTIVFTFGALNASGYYPLTGTGASIALPGFFAASNVDPISGYYPATKTIRAKFTAGIFNIDETYTYTGPRTTTK